MFIINAAKLLLEILNLNSNFILTSFFKNSIFIRLKEKAVKYNIFYSFMLYYIIYMSMNRHTKTLKQS